MKKKEEKIKLLIREIEAIIERSRRKEKKFKKALSKVHPRFRKSARNLIHYRALRLADIRNVQKELGNKGLSRLAKSDSHVMASLLTNKFILEKLLGKPKAKMPRLDYSFKESNKLSKSNAKALLGYRTKNRRTRIMVTLPTEAASSYQMVHDMIANGMNCARINCAHDDAEVWRQMILNVRKASKKLRRKCKVAMDLGGPKIRTGPLAPGPRVRKFRPAKDDRGQITAPLQIWMAPTPPDDPQLPYLPVDCSHTILLKKGDRLFFRDARNKKRALEVVAGGDSGYLVQAFKTTFAETGMKMYKDPEFHSESIEVGEFPPVGQAILLHKGDTLRLHKAPIPGENAKMFKNGKVKSPAHLSCTLPEVFGQVKTGEPIFFDDGKTEGVIREVREEELIIEIVHARDRGSKLRADKGINLPASDLKINGLTAKDKTDLEFVAHHADVVNLSFVNRPQDVRDLFAVLKKLKAPRDLGIILKIETQSGFNQLTQILLEAMQVHPIGVMIARGDLAIECGWNNIGRVQEEILNLCQAASVPDVWATQVLENLSKQGIPSRAEITDAAMAQRADCVMLNKGPYILQSIKLLDAILKDMAPYQEKKSPLSPMMSIADIRRG